jgi:hypothetical protein
MGSRRFDIRRDIGRTSLDIRRIVTAFSEGDPLWVRENGLVYDVKLGRVIGRVLGGPDWEKAAGDCQNFLRRM